MIQLHILEILLNWEKNIQLKITYLRILNLFLSMAMAIANSSKPEARLTMIYYNYDSRFTISNGD